MSRFIKLPSGIIVPNRPGIRKPSRVAGLTRRAFIGGLGSAIIVPKEAVAGFLINSYQNAAPLTPNYRNTYVDTSTATSFTFNNVDFGPAATNRVVHIFIVSLASNNPTPVSATTTIGGVAPTVNSATTGNRAAHLFSAVVPTGDTGTVFIPMSASSVGVLIHVWSGYPSSATPVDAVWGGLNGTPVNVLDVAKTNGGYTIMASVWEIELTTQGTVTQTGAETIIEHYEAASGDIRTNAGFHMNTATTTTDDYTQNVVSANEHRMIVASWF